MESPQLTCISLHVLSPGFTNTNFALHDSFEKPKVALWKDPVYFHHRELLQPNLCKQQSNLQLHPQIYLLAVQTLGTKMFGTGGLFM